MVTALVKGEGISRTTEFITQWTSVAQGPHVLDLDVVSYIGGNWSLKITVGTAVHSIQIFPNFGSNEFFYA